MGFRERKVFWKFFASFSVLILIPVTVSSIILYFYSVRMVEQEAEKSNTIVLGNFSRNMDKFFNTLQSDMINLLRYPILSFMIRETETSDAHYFINTYDRKQAVEELSGQIAFLENKNELIDSAFLYFPANGYILTSSKGMPEDDFFANAHHVVGMSSKEYFDIFKNKHTMSFLSTLTVEKRDPFTQKVLQSGKVVPVVSSFPIHTQPQVSLVINLKEQELRDMITFPDQRHIQAVILDRDGNMISSTGNYDFDAKSINDKIGGSPTGSSILNLAGGKVNMSYVRSEVNGWKYVSLVSLNELHKPAVPIRRVSELFFILFSSIGIAVSYWLSKRMYSPIRDIKALFEKLTKFKSDTNRGKKNEFDLISAWSQSMIDESNVMSHQIREMKPIMEEKLLIQILTGQLREKDTIREYAMSINMDLDYSSKLVICIEMKYSFEALKSLGEKERLLIDSEIRRKWTDSFGRGFYVAEIRKDVLACIISMDESTKMFGITVIVDKLAEILKPYTLYLKPTIAVGDKADCPEELHVSYLKALNKLEWKSFTSDLEVIGEQNEIEITRHLGEGYLNSDDANKISNLIRASSKDELLGFIYGLLGQYVEHKYSAKQVLGLGQDIMNMMIRIANEINNTDYIIGKYAEWKNQLELCTNLRQLQELYQEVCELIVKMPETKDDREAVFKEVTEYIHEHYDEDLSLEYFADRYEMSLGYFSRCFKEAVGEKYVDYVNKARLFHAKKLLVETDLKIEEISLKVGYLSSKSFNTIFKKYEGISPGNYRKIYKTSA